MSDDAKERERAAFEAWAKEYGMLLAHDKADVALTWAAWQAARALPPAAGEPPPAVPASERELSLQDAYVEGFVAGRTTESLSGENEVDGMRMFTRSGARAQRNRHSEMLVAERDAALTEARELRLRLERVVEGSKGASERGRAPGGWIVARSDGSVLSVYYVGENGIAESVEHAQRLAVERVRYLNSQPHGVEGWRPYIAEPFYRAAPPSAPSGAPASDARPAPGRAEALEEAAKVCLDRTRRFDARTPLELAAVKESAACAEAIRALAAAPPAPATREREQAVEAYGPHQTTPSEMSYREAYINGWLARASRAAPASPAALTPEQRAFYEAARAAIVYHGYNPPPRLEGPYEAMIVAYRAMLAAEAPAPGREGA
jgi:hypothetical protein